jgi:hypothetical protein
MNRTKGSMTRISAPWTQVLPHPHKYAKPAYFYLMKEYAAKLRQNFRLPK